MPTELEQTIIFNKSCKCSICNMMRRSWAQGIQVPITVIYSMGKPSRMLGLG